MVRQSALEVAGIDLFIWAVVAAWLIGFGAAAAMFAVRRRREPGTWAVFGAILGPAALALLRVAPPGRCWSCAAPTEGWLTFCPWCGEDIREPVSRIPESPRVAEVVPQEQIRTHGPLTVIEGSAPRELPRRPEPLDLSGPAPSNRPAIVLNVPTALERRSADSATRDRRIDLAAQPPLAEQARRMSEASAAASAAGLEPDSDPVRRLKASLGRSQSLGAAPNRVPAPTQHAHPGAEARSIVLASAIYVTGSRGLLAGSRYGIALFGDELRILGPVDVDPTAVAIRHAIRGMDATGLQGRLIITATDGRRDQLALVFMSVAGGSPEGVADAIIGAATELRAEAR